MTKKFFIRNSWVMGPIFYIPLTELTDEVRKYMDGASRYVYTHESSAFTKNDDGTETEHKCMVYNPVVRADVVIGMLGRHGLTKFE